LCFKAEDIFGEIRMHFETLVKEKSSEAPPERWEFCFDALSNRLPHVFSWLYVHNSSESKSRDPVKSIVSAITKEFTVRISDNRWMDEVTRRSALTKVNNESDCVQSNHDGQGSCINLRQLN
jgi:predicted metalloendopeptidase